MTAAMTGASDSESATEGVRAGCGRLAAGLAALAAWAAMLAASLVNFLHYQHVPLARAEVAMFAAALLGIALAMAALHASLGRIGRAAMVALLMFAAIDINADQLEIAAALALAAGAAAWRWSGEALRFLTLAFGVVLATGLIGLGGRADGVETTEKAGAAAMGDARRPLLVQIILDEQAGPAGLPANDGRWLEQRYRGLGFSVYSNAYSRHYHTKNSLAGLISGIPAGGGIADRMRGIPAHVIQTDFFPLCRPFRAVRCTTYSASSLKALDRQPIAAADKAQLIAYHFGGLSTIARKITNAYDKLARPAGLPTVELRSVRKVPQMNAVELVPRVEADLSAARPGQYHLVHLLLPHAPFSYDERCQMLPTSAWRAEREHAPQAERDSAYRRQMECAARVVERLVAAVGRSPGGANAVIIVHGDHGSRIVEVEPSGEDAAKASDEDVRRGFAALFAVRIPGQPAARVGQPAALGELFDALADSGFAALPRPAPSADGAWVNVGYKGWQPTTRRRLVLPAGE